MITRLGLVLLVMLPLVVAAEEIQPTKFGNGIITLPVFPRGQVPKGKQSPLTVVRDAKAYAIVLDLIPRKQISRTRPAPPNTDLLLKRPKIDFSKHILLVASRPSMTRPVFRHITKSKNRIVVVVNFPRDQIAARPIHLGTYSAVLIPKTDLPVHLQLVEAQR
jgi:hypothetical protein